MNKTGRRKFIDLSGSLTNLGKIECHVDVAGYCEVVLHDERDHLRGVLGGIDVPRQSEGYKYSFMSLKYIFILFDYFCTLWVMAIHGVLTLCGLCSGNRIHCLPISFLYFPIAMLYSRT